MLSNSVIRPHKVALCTVLLFGLTSVAISPAVAEDTVTSVETRAATAGDETAPETTAETTGIDGTAPTITGTFLVGESLVATAGTWDPDTVQLSVQWHRDGVAVEGATGTTYELTPEDAETVITVSVTGSAEGEESVTLTSDPTDPITPDTEVPAVTVSLAGGHYQAGTSVELSAGEKEDIYYTLDGSVPTVDSTLYEGAITLTEDVTLTYYAVDPSDNASEPAAETYTTYPDFTDVDGETLFQVQIEWAAENGISTGWTLEDGTVEFRPYEDVNRDAMAAFLYRLAGSPEFDAPAVSPFVDYDAENLFYKEVTWLHSEGISTGWVNEEEGTSEYRPFEDINRDAMAAFLYRMAGTDFKATGDSPFVDYSEDNMFYDEVTWLASTGISTGWVDEEDGTREFRAFTDINRDAMAAFMFRYNNIFDIH